MTGLHLDGRTLRGEVVLTADVIVVGSGPAGAAVARELAQTGIDVLVVEAGRWFTPDEFPESAFAAMSTLYRSMSASVTIGASPIPYIQAQMVGGSSPINGAICWRLPPDVHTDWLAHDPALAETLPWTEIEAHTDEIETRLNVSPTDPQIAGRKSTLMALGADALGLSHRPIRRNVVGCEGLGRCLQGCPNGRKLSVDRTLLLDAMADGARVLSSVKVEQIVTHRRQYLGVDLSLPDIARKLLWHTFRKTFVHTKNGDVRGWNVRMAQHGIDGAREPLRKRDGRPITFGHYRIRSAVGHTFPRGWRGTHFLDYGSAGNSRLDPARLGYAPLVAVNPGDQDLLLGWEVFKIGPTKTPFPFFWALCYEGPVDEIVEPVNPL